MVGRDFLTLKHFTNAEVETLLWTAMDLKERIKGNGEVIIFIHILIIYLILEYELIFHKITGFGMLDK